MIKAVLFDFDDTLARSWEQKWAHHKHTAKESYGVELTDETLSEHWGKPFNKMVGLLYNHADTEENMMTENERTRDQFPKLPMDGAIETLELLRAEGIQLGVITSTLTQLVQGDLDRMGFSLDSFFHIQGADDSPFPKPDPRVFDNALLKLADEGIIKEEVAYVGDSLFDTKAALGAGVHFVAVTTGRDTAEELREAGATHIIKDIRELPGYVSGL